MEDGLPRVTYRTMLQSVVGNVIEIDVNVNDIEMQLWSPSWRLTFDYWS